MTHAKPAPSRGPLVEVAREVAADRRPAHSSFLLIEKNEDALRWRLALIDSARSSVDCQYFLWNGDYSGKLLMDRLYRAAEHGVRVRILIDDILMKGADRSIAAFSRHPNFELRLFNPRRVRSTNVGKLGEFLVNFSELNRRMHNKSLTADGSLSIVGGRNIGDHYFGLDARYNFRDLDVLVAGPVVKEVSESFDSFWNSEQSHPGESLSKRATDDDRNKLAADLRAFVAEHKEGPLKRFPAEPVSWERELAGLEKAMATGPARFLSDEVAPDRDARLVLTTLREIGARERAGSGTLEGRRLLIASPYFIPSDRLLSNLEALQNEGLQVTFVVPTLDANNHASAHAHYRKHRKRVLRTGAELFEYKHQPSEASRAMADTDPVRANEVNHHMKAFVGSEGRCFIGSLNLDPRAMVINTESGLLIESDRVSTRLAGVVEMMTKPENAWHLSLDDRGEVEWSSGEEVRCSQPASNSWKRIQDVLARWLPIESQL